MNKKMKIAFACYLIVFGSYLLMGAVYLLYPTVMPYHLAVIGSGWKQVEPRTQAMLLVFLHAVGAAEISLSVAGLIITVIPFRKGAAWTKWALPAIFAPNGIFLSYITFYLFRTYGALTPWPATWALMLICAAAFVLTMLKD